MTKRIKITGYIDIDDLEEEYVDLDDPTGLSAEGFEAIMIGEGPPFIIADLQENDAVLEES